MSAKMIGRTGSRLSYDTLDMALTETGEAILLAGQYRILCKLGEGGMGMVYLAEDLEMHNMQVAVKILPPLLARNRRAVENLRSEAFTAIQLNHPNIVRLYGFHSDMDIKFLVMEYIEGKTLEEVILESPSHRLTLEKTLRLAEQAAAGLDYAHGRTPPVVHRDLKPSNIMIDKLGHVKILDFGIAREMKDSYTRVSGKSDTSGTLPYMSPEQLMGQRPTPAMDIYSIAAACYECLSGNAPFYTGDIASQIRSKTPDPIASVPPSVNAALLSALAKNPDSRPVSAGQMVTQLGGTVKTAYTQTAFHPDTSRTSASRVKRLLVFLLLVVLTAAVTLGWREYSEYRVRENIKVQQQITDMQGQITLLLADGDLESAGIRLSELERLGGTIASRDLRLRYDSLVMQRRTNEQYAEASVAKDNVLRLDRGQGFAARLESLEKQWRQAEAARQIQAWRQALTDYETVLAECKALLELDEVRRKALALCQKVDDIRQRSDIEVNPVMFKDADTKYSAAMTAFEEGDFNRALESWEQAILSYGVVKEYLDAQSAFTSAISEYELLLRQWGGAKWQEVLRQSRRGAASAGDLVTGAAVYRAAYDGLPEAISEAQQVRDDLKKFHHEKNAYEVALSEHRTLLEHYGFTIWQQIRQQSDIGSAGVNNPTAGAAVYRAARQTLQEATIEATDRMENYNRIVDQARQAEQQEQPDAALDLYREARRFTNLSLETIISDLQTKIEEQRRAQDDAKVEVYASAQSAYEKAYFQDRLLLEQYGGKIWNALLDGLETGTDTGNDPVAIEAAYESAINTLPLAVEEAIANKRAHASEQYHVAQSAFLNAFSEHQSLLEEFGGSKWDDVRNQSRIGADKADDPSAGKAAYEAALDGLAAAIAQAEQTRSRIQAVNEAIGRAKAAKANGQWQDVIETLKWISINPSQWGQQGELLSRQITRLIEEAEQQFLPRLNFFVIIDGREVPGATVRSAQQVWQTPTTISLEKDKEYVFEVSYEQVGAKRYNPERIIRRADWTGEKTIRVTLTELSAQAASPAQEINDLQNKLRTAIDSADAVLLATVQTQIDQLTKRASDDKAAGDASRAKEAYRQALLLAESVRHLPKEKELIVGDVNIDLVLIPADVNGFMMGSDHLDRDAEPHERPVHQVVIPRRFYMGQYEITRAQYKAVMNPDWVVTEDTADFPVAEVSWYEAMEFCLRVSGITGYRVTLPTEAEWEYACRARRNTIYCYGNSLDSLREVGWCSYNRRPADARHPKKIGQFRPNLFGLYDMHGNVAEWCLNSPYNYRDQLSENPPIEGDKRAIRGGSWYDGPEQCRSAARRFVDARIKDNKIGFRIILKLD